MENNKLDEYIKEVSKTETHKVTNIDGIPKGHAFDFIDMNGNKIK